MLSSNAYERNDTISTIGSVVSFLLPVPFLERAEVVLVLFGNTIGWFLDRNAIAVGRGVVVRLLLIFRWGHQVKTDGAYQPLDAIPARGIAVGVEFFLALTVIDVEGIILIIVAIVDPGIGDTYQFQHLQSRAGLRLRVIIAGLVLPRGLDLRHFYSGMPDIQRNTVGGRFGIEVLGHLGAVDQFAHSPLSPTILVCVRSSNWRTISRCRTTFPVPAQLEHKEVLAPWQVSQTRLPLPQVHSTSPLTQSGQGTVGPFVAGSVSMGLGMGIPCARMPSNMSATRSLTACATLSACFLKNGFFSRSAQSAT